MKKKQEKILQKYYNNIIFLLQIYKIHKNVISYIAKYEKIAYNYINGVN